MARLGHFELRDINLSFTIHVNCVLHYFLTLKSMQVIEIHPTQRLHDILKSITCLLMTWCCKEPGGPLNIKMSYQYWDSHVKDKTVSPTVLSLTWESPYLGKTVFILRKTQDLNNCQLISSRILMPCTATVNQNFDGLVENCSISIANTLEILQSCTKHWSELYVHWHSDHGNHDKLWPNIAMNFRAFFLK